MNAQRLPTLPGASRPSCGAGPAHAGGRWRTALSLALCLGAVAACAAEEAQPGTHFALLYSTSGYEAGGTKRAVLRGLGGAPDFDENRSRWRVVDADGEVRKQGALQPRGVAFGSPLWRIDFSELRARGAGFRLQVSLVPPPGRKGAAIELESLPFPVETSLFSQRMARGLALENAEVRRAPAAMGGGYYDCNTTMGEATSHAMFAMGLIEFERRRGAQLEPPERARLRDEIHRAIDYVLSLHDEESGEIANQHPSRPHGNAGDFNTQEGVYGLVQYLSLESAADPARSAEIARRARTSLAYLQGRDALYPALGAAVWARLHLHSGQATDLDEAVRHVEALVAGFEPRTWFRHPLRGVPWFEGMALLVPRVEPDRRERWLERARVWSVAFRRAAVRNGYGVVPPLGEAEWDDPIRAPVSSVEHAFYANAFFLTTAVDALLLAQLTGQRGLEGTAAAALQWVTGVNPGIRAEHATGPPAAPGEPAVVAASFVVNSPGRHVRAWLREAAALDIPEEFLWWWKPFADSPQALTVVNGFLAPPERGLVYDPSEWQPAETHIRSDGLLLRAALRYEDRLASRPGGLER